MGLGLSRKLWYYLNKRIVPEHEIGFLDATKVINDSSLVRQRSPLHPLSAPYKTLRTLVNSHLRNAKAWIVFARRRVETSAVIPFSGPFFMLSIDALNRWNLTLHNFDLIFRSRRIQKRPNFL